MRVKKDFAKKKTPNISSAILIAQDATFQNTFWYKRGRLYLSVRQLLPLRLADPDGVQHTGELEPVLGTVDELR